MYIVAVCCCTKTVVLCGMLCSLLAIRSGSDDRQQVPVVCSLSTQHGVLEENGSLCRDHYENLKSHMEMNLWLPGPCSAVLQGHSFEACNGFTASSSHIEYSAPNGVTTSTS